MVPDPVGKAATSGQPAGTAGYMGFRLSGINGVEWYNGTRWAYALESTFARGTSTRIPFFDANGQVTESGNMLFSSNVFQLTNNGTNVNYILMSNLSYAGSPLRI